MPSVSQSQHRYIAMKAAHGEAWAKTWLHHDKGQVKNLPEHKHRREAMRRTLSYPQ